MIIAMAFDSKNYQYSTGKHENRNLIFVHFRYNPVLHKELKERFSSAKWNSAKEVWYLPDTYSIRKEIGLAPKTEMGKEVISKSPLDDL